MTKEIPAVFPFTLETFFGNSLFGHYVSKHREELEEKYGEYCLTSRNGKTGSFKVWGYSDVKAEAISETMVKFTTYDTSVYDRHSSFASFPEVQLIIEQEYPSHVLADRVEKRKREIAEVVFERREKEERQRAIDAVYEELFSVAK